jgi:hypothetical protein
MRDMSVLFLKIQSDFMNFSEHWPFSAGASGHALVMSSTNIRFMCRSALGIGTSRANAPGSPQNRETGKGKTKDGG